MPWKTKSGTHYHMTEGCCGADIDCSTAGLEPCSICCGRGRDEAAAGMTGVALRACDEGDSVWLEDGYVLQWREAWETGLPEDGYVLEEPTHGNPVRIATEDDLAEVGRQLADGRAHLGSGSDPLLYGEGAKEFAEGRAADMGRGIAAEEEGTIGPSPMPGAPAGDIGAAIADLERQLAELRSLQAEEETAALAVDEAAIRAAEESADRGLRRVAALSSGEGSDSELFRYMYDEEVYERLMSLEWDTRHDMGAPLEVGAELDQVTRARLVHRVAGLIESEGYGDKLSEQVLGFLEGSNERNVLSAIELVRERRERRQAVRDWDVAERISAMQDEAMDEMGLRSVPMDRRDELARRVAAKIQAEGLGDSLTDGVSGALTSMNAHTANIAADLVRSGGPIDVDDAPAGKPKARRGTRQRLAERGKALIDGMTPKEEQDAFDREFTTHETDGYMGSRGYAGSKSGSQRHYSDAGLAKDVRDDLKKWLGHIGVPRGAVRVRKDSYSGGRSLAVSARLDRTRYGASEEEFKSAYRREFWRMMPRWGSVETSSGMVDVGRLMDHGVDQGPLIEDIIDTAWQRFQSGDARVVGTRRRSTDWGAEQLVYLNDEGRRVADRMERVIRAYNHDDSNGQVDYFDVGFYYSSNVTLV